MAPVAFQIMSDLHLETYPSYDFPIKQTAPNLALLGDIGHVGDDRLFAFLEQQLRRYWNVFFLLGNHEPVQGGWDSAKTKMRSFSHRMETLRSTTTLGRFVFLDQTRYRFETITVLGCTLFSNITPDQAKDVGNRLIDFNQILNWSVADHNTAHSSDLNWLNAQVSEISKKEPHRRIVVFTHHSPSIDPRAMNPRHSDSPVQSGFATDLSNEECRTNKAVVMWAFGHTHYNCDFVDDCGTRLVTNQRGYASALEQGFDGQAVFLVGGTPVHEWELVFGTKLYGVADIHLSFREADEDDSVNGTVHKIRFGPDNKTSGGRLKFRDEGWFREGGLDIHIARPSTSLDIVPDVETSLAICNQIDCYLNNKFHGGDPMRNNKIWLQVFDNDYHKETAVTMMIAPIGKEKDPSALKENPIH